MKVFISHQKKDRDYAEQIAKYLLSVNIDVYFDEYDHTLQTADRRNNPTGVVTAIKRGIQSSTHMFCIISPNTLYSQWVPFEVGYGYDHTELYVLTMKGIKNSDLPDYVKIVPIIRDIHDINKFIKDRGAYYGLILEHRNFSNYNNIYHPLYHTMDSYITP